MWIDLKRKKQLHIFKDCLIFLNLLNIIQLNFSKKIALFVRKIMEGYVYSIFSVIMEMEFWYKSRNYF